MLEQIYAHCAREAPVEACGVIVGRDGRCERVVALRNELESQTRFSVSDDDVRVLYDAMANDEDLVVLWHSHTLGRKAIPSVPDIELTPPGVVALIVPVELSGLPGRARLWECAAGQAVEIPLTTR